MSARYSECGRSVPLGTHVVEAAHGPSPASTTGGASGSAIKRVLAELVFHIEPARQAAGRRMLPSRVARVTGRYLRAVVAGVRPAAATASRPRLFLELRTGTGGCCRGGRRTAEMEDRASA